MSEVKANCLVSLCDTAASKGRCAHGVSNVVSIDVGQGKMIISSTHCKFAPPGKDWI